MHGLIERLPLRSLRAGGQTHLGNVSLTVKPHMICYRVSEPSAYGLGGLFESLRREVVIINVKNDLRVFLALALVVCGGVGSVALSWSWGPLYVGMRVVAKTPLYVGREAEMKATIYVRPHLGDRADYWDAVDIALVWTGDGMEILGDDVIYFSVDPPETVTVSFHVRVNSPNADAGFSAYMRATPQAYRCLTPNHPMIKMAESGVEKIGKGWLYLNQGGDNWKTVKGDEKGELLTGEERAKIRRKKEGAFAKKLAATRAGNYRPDESILAAIDQGLAEEMQMEMDSALAEVSDAMRVELAMVAEELGRRTKTPAEDAAAFLCGMVRSRWRSIWRTDPNADINRVAAPVLEIHGLGRLVFMYKETRRVAASPTGEAWEVFGRASKGEMTWDEAEAELDSLLREHPKDKELLRNASGIRNIIEELKKEEGRVGDSNISSGERDGWVIVQGTWNYRDHAYTEFGLESSTTDRPVRSAVTYVRVYGPGGPYWWGPSLTYDNGSFTISEYWWLDGIGLTTWIWAEGPVVHPASPMHVIKEDSSAYRFEGNSDYSTVPTDITINLGTSYPEGDSTAAMKIYDVLFQGWTKIPGSKPWAHDLKLVWEPGYRPPILSGASHYDPVTKMIHLRGKLADTDEWDTDIILHEQGHWLHDVLSNFPTSYTSDHEWSREYPSSNQRATAYIEGFATFYAAYAEEGYVFDPLMRKLHVNTYGGTTGGGSMYASVECPWDYIGTLPDPQDRNVKLQWGNYNEASVCGALWDMLDADNELYDVGNSPDHYDPRQDPLRDDLSAGIVPIWNTFTDITYTIDTFNVFLERWFAQPYGNLDEISEIAQHHGCGRNLRADQIDAINPYNTHWVQFQVAVDEEVSTTLRLTNHNNAASESFEITENISWLDLSQTTGTIPPVGEPGTGTVDLMVTVNSTGHAEDLYVETITITNTGTDRCTLQTPVTMRVTAEPVIEGTVVKHAGGGPANGAVVEAWEGGYPDGVVVEQDVTGPDGWFMLHVEEGTYDLRAYLVANYTSMRYGVPCPSMGVTIELGEYPTPTGSGLSCSTVGYASTFQGAPLQLGDVVAVRDPDGVLCGIAEVGTLGGYGPIVVYGDDAVTPEDEGAEEGDTLKLYVNYCVAQPEGPDPAVWTSGGSLNVEIAAVDGAPLTPDSVEIHADSSGTYLCWWPVVEDVYGGEEEIVFYLVYRSEDPFFEVSGLTPEGYGGPFGYADHDGGAGSVENDYFYIVTAEDILGQESAPSETLGEFDFSLGSRGESASRGRQSHYEH